MGPESLPHVRACIQPQWRQTGAAGRQQETYPVAARCTTREISSRTWLRRTCSNVEQFWQEEFAAITYPSTRMKVYPLWWAKSIPSCVATSRELTTGPPSAGLWNRFDHEKSEFETLPEEGRHLDAAPIGKCTHFRAVSSYNFDRRLPALLRLLRKLLGK